MSHIVESCPLTKLNGGLSRLHSADEDAVSWLTRIREEEEVQLTEQFTPSSAHLSTASIGVNRP